TTQGDNHRWKLYPSPDGRWLAHTDKKGRFWLLDLATRGNQLIDDAGKAGVDKHDEVQWSPDSRNLAIVRVASNEQREQIGLYNLASKQLQFVTSDRYTSASPVFSPDGRWLYFMSARNFQLANGSPWGDRNMGPVFDKRIGVYALALQPGNRFPFQADDELSRPGVKPAETDDEKAAESAAEKALEKAGGKSAVKKAPAALPDVVFKGLAERLYEVPLAAGNYSALAIDDKRLYFLDRESGENKSSLKTLAIGNAGSKPELLVANVREFDLAQDKKHLYYRTAAATGPGEMLVIEAGAKLPSDLSKAKVKVDDWTFVSNPRLEWKQMFNDAWRLHRDFLYDAKMRGVDWKAARDKYAPLVERVTDRAELNDVL
ncbi:MAG: peptidase S41, partial [Janthinobacterium sp.]